MSLRCWEADDWQEFRHIAADPDVIRYIGDGTPWPDERSRRFVERQITHYRERGFCLWKLTPKAGGPLIGFCGLQPLQETQEIEIGWWLARAWWGRGLATEAGHVALRDGFERVGLERIVAIAQPANTASVHIMQKLGMRFERMTESSGIPVAMYVSGAGPRPAAESQAAKSEASVLFRSLTPSVKISSLSPEPLTAPPRPPGRCRHAFLSSKEHHVPKSLSFRNSASGAGADFRRLHRHCRRRAGGRASKHGSQLAPLGRIP